MKTKLEEVREKYYSKIPKKLFNRLVNLDPTCIPGKKMGRYGKWILCRYKDGDILEEDYYKVTEYLKALSKFRFTLKGVDINKIKTLPDLYHEVSDLLEKKSQKDKEGDIKNEGLELVYSDDSWKAFKIKTHAASCLIGAGTQWCTASHSSYRFKQYSKSSPLFVFIKDKRKYQYHFSCGLYNEYDSLVGSHSVKEDFDNSEEVKAIILKNQNTFLPLPWSLNNLEVEFKGWRLFHYGYEIRDFIPPYYINVVDSGPNYEYRNAVLDIRSKKVLFKFHYGAVVNFKDGLFVFKKDSKISYVDTDGEFKDILVDFSNYKPIDYIERFKDDSFLLVSATEAYRVNKKTGELLGSYLIYSSSVKPEYRQYYNRGYDNAEPKYFYDQEKKEFLLGFEPPKGLGLYVSYYSKHLDSRTISLVSYTCFMENEIAWVKHNSNTYGTRKKITINDSSLKIGRKTVLSGYPKGRDHKFVFVRGPEFNGICSQGIRSILVCPYGWAFYEEKVVKGSEEVWHKEDPRDYLGGVGVLWNLYQKKGKHGKKLGKKIQDWFKYFEEL